MFFESLACEFIIDVRFSRDNIFSIHLWIVLRTSLPDKGRVPQVVQIDAYKSSEVSFSANESCRKSIDEEIEIKR